MGVAHIIITCQVDSQTVDFLENLGFMHTGTQYMEIEGKYKKFHQMHYCGPDIEISMSFLWNGKELYAEDIPRATLDMSSTRHVN